ncbi:hypothetical protein ABK040_009333 [Willaertia magna]
MTLNQSSSEQQTSKEDNTMSSTNTLLSTNNISTGNVTANNHHSMMNETIPQLSLSILNISLRDHNNNDHHHHVNISTSTSPNKHIPSTLNNNMFHSNSNNVNNNTENNNNIGRMNNNQEQPKQPHQLELSPRFDAPYTRPRGNSNGLPPIGNSINNAPRFDSVSISHSPAANINPFVNGVPSSPYHGNQQTISMMNGNSNMNTNTSFSPLIGSPNQNNRSSYVVPHQYNSPYSSHGYLNPSSLNESPIVSDSFMMINSLSPSVSPNTSPRLSRAMIVGGRSNSMPPIPAFSMFSSPHPQNDEDLDKMNNYISKSVNMKVLEEDEDLLEQGNMFTNGNGWYGNNGYMNINNGHNGYEDQFVVGHLEMSPSQPMLSPHYDPMSITSPNLGISPFTNGMKNNRPMNFIGTNLSATSNICPIISTSNFSNNNISEAMSPTSTSSSSSTGTGSDGGSKSHKHPGEYPSRTLFVRNISSNVEDEELKELFESFGPVRNMYTACKHRGFVMITYYDIRHAKQAKKNLQSKLIKKRKIDIHYSIPKENPSDKDQQHNQETLVVFNLDPSITNEELKTIFTQFGGDVKEIRETPNKKFHKFIEFYDTRDAEKAMKQLNKTELKGKKIKIEYSRPGGLRNKYTGNDPIMPSSPVNTPVLFNSPTPLATTLTPPKNDLHGAKGRRRALSAEEKEQFKLDLGKVLCGLDKRTTLMVKNIPNKYTQKMLLETIDGEFKTKYDFFYLPIDFKNKCNVGYAFINFVDAKSIVPFVERFNHKKWEKFNSEKVCDITYARIQGKNNLINHFQNSSLMCEDEDCRPIFY